MPSVVLGFFGLVVLAPLIARVFNLNSGLNAFNGALLVGIMALPTIITLAEDAITAVPREYRHASLALGGTRWQVVRTVVLPRAIPGIMTGTILGLARAAGETAPILATGAAFFLPHLPDSIRSQFMALPYHLFIMSTQHHAISQVRPIAYGTALVLLALVCLLNLAAVLLRKRYRDKVAKGL